MATLTGNRNFIRFIQDTEPTVHKKGDLWLATGTGSDTGLYKAVEDAGAWISIFKKSSPGDTGIFGGGNTGPGSDVNIIDQVTISSAGNATDFGDLTVSRIGLTATSNGTSNTGLFGGGETGGTSRINTIDQVTISSAGNATDFGDLTITNWFLTATSNGTSDTGIFGGGESGGTEANTIDQVTISSAGNATDFGDLTVARSQLSATSNGTSDTGIFGGGYSGSFENTIDQVTISSAGNATDFGDLTVARSQLSATSNGTNDTGIFGGGNTGPEYNIIDQVTISSASNATDFGDLPRQIEKPKSTSNGINDTGLFGGGSSDTFPFEIDISKVTISSPGNATDFGNLTDGRVSLSATSNGLT